MIRLTRRSSLTAAAAALAQPARGQPRITLAASHALLSWTEMRAGLVREQSHARPDVLLTWVSGSDDWDTTLQDTLRQSIINGLPDLSHQSLNNVRTLAERGLAVPLDRFLAAAGGWDEVGYLPSLRDAAIHDGATLAVPFAITIPVLYVNIDLARTAGFSGDALPSDWPGILDLARRITARGGGAMGLFVEYDATSAWIFQSLVASLGGRMMSPDEKDIAFDSPAGLQAMELTREFGLAGHRDMLNAQARQAFNAGRTGIHIRSASGIKPVKDAVTGHFELRIGAFPIPAPNGRLPGAGNGIVMLTRDPERQNAVWDYMLMATTAPGQTVVAQTSGYLPTNARVVRDPAGLGAFYAANPAGASPPALAFMKGVPMIMTKIGLALALAAVTSGLCCHAVSAYARTAETLTVSFSNQDYKAFLEEADRRYGQQHPDVKVVLMDPVPTHGEHLARTLRLAVTGGLQDVSFQGYDQIAILVRRHLAVPLTGFVEREQDWSTQGLTAASMDAGKVGAEIYALPFESATPTLFFNMDLVRRAGGDPEKLPQDWDGIIALAHGIHALGPTITGAFFDYNAAGDWTFQAMITSLGGHLMSEDDTSIRFNGTEGREALDIIRRVGQTGMFDMTQPQAFQAFAAGQIGIITQSNTFLRSFEDNARGRFQIKTTRWPLPSKEGRIPIGGRSMMMLTTDPQQQTIAWDYMKFMTSPATQTLLAKMTSTTPVNMVAIRGPDYLGGFYRDNPNQLAAVDALPFVTGWYSFPGDNAQRIIDVIRDHIRDVAIKQTDVDKELAAMSKDVQDLLP